MPGKRKNCRFIHIYPSGGGGEAVFGHIYLVFVRLPIFFLPPGGAVGAFQLEPGVGESAHVVANCPPLAIFLLYLMH